MPKQKTLADLYVRGNDLTLDDGQNQVKVWVQKLNPVETSQAARKADAARARVLTVRRDRQSEECMAVYSDILALTRDEQIEYLVNAERSIMMPKVEEELATTEEWAKDGYLQGLRDAWREGLAEVFVDNDEEHADWTEAQRVHDELVRFLDLVVKETNRNLEDHQEALGTMSSQELEDAVAELHFRNIGDRTWLEEFYRCEIWLGVRSADDHHERIFDKRAEVDELQLELLDQLKDSFRAITVDPVEGKDSAGNPPSSESSEAPVTPDPDPSSGQPAAAA